MQVLAIIPARGGSKGLPDKNLRLAGGKPLLAWTVDAAAGSKHVHRMVLSTNDARIAGVGRDLGADVPFMRPDYLAQDNTPGMDPVLYTIRRLAEEDSYHPDCVMLLQPTSPLRETADIDAAVEMLVRLKADGVVSLTRSRHHPYWTKKLDDDGFMTDFIRQETAATCRQQLPAAYALNGAIYLARTSVLLERESWYTSRTAGYIMPTERSVDVDTSWDLMLADLLLRDRGASDGG